MSKIFFAKTVQGPAIKTLVDVLKEIINDVNITLSPQGMKIKALDASKTALVHLFLKSENFEDYQCSEEQVIGINMLAFNKLIKSVSNNDTLMLSIIKGSEHVLHIEIVNIEKKYNHKFELKLLDIDNEIINIPKIELNSVVTLPSAELQKLCRDMLNISQYVTITNRGGNLIMEVDGDYARQRTVLGDPESEESEEVIEGTYSLKYLNLFTKATNLCNNVEIYMKSNYPIIIKYGVANLGELRFCLAPRCDD